MLVESVDIHSYTVLFLELLCTCGSKPKTLQSIVSIVLYQYHVVSQKKSKIKNQIKRREDTNKKLGGY